MKQELDGPLGCEKKNKRHVISRKTEKEALKSDSSVWRVGYVSASSTQASLNSLTDNLAGTINSTKKENSRRHPARKLPCSFSCG
jgi:hypothetical protein